MLEKYKIVSIYDSKNAIKEKTEKSKPYRRSFQTSSFSLDHNIPVYLLTDSLFSLFDLEFES